MAFKPPVPKLLDKQVRIFIYGGAGVGKSTTALSLLKNPNLKLVLLALEATTLEAVRNCFEVHQIEELLPGQLTLVVPDPAKAANEDAFKSNTDGTFFDNIVKALFARSEATDVATGEAVKLKAFNQYDEDTVLIFDGVSALVETVTNRANSDALVKKVSDNGMAVYGIGQKYITGLFNQLTKGTRAHVIVLGHQKMADDKAVAKYQGIKALNPDVYTRSLVDSVCGMFTWVMYAKRNTQNNQFTLSISEAQAYTRDAMNRAEFKRVVDELNKSRKPHEKIDLNSLPTDLTSPVWPFMKGE